MDAMTSDADWQFMEPWFETLGEAGLEDDPNETDDSDDVRIGRDPGDDTWIGVGLSRETFDVDRGEIEHEDDYDDNEWVRNPGVAVRLRRLREAIVLTSLMGRTDYKWWLKLMHDHPSFDIAHHYKVPMNGALLPLPIQFYFELHTDHPVEFFDWSTCLRHLLGDQLHSEEFEADRSEMARLLTLRRIPWEGLEPTPIKIGLVFDADPQGGEMVTRRIMRLVDSIQRTQRIERSARAAGQSCSNLLKVVCVEVDLSEVLLLDSTIDALTSLFQLGVPVALLRLPKLGRRDPSMASWGPFIRLITGVDQDDEGRLASAKRIEMPVEYVGTVFFASLCSALACAQGVQAFSLVGHQPRTNIVAETDDRDHMWRWLAFIFHNEVATTSVRTLIIDGERPVANEIMAFQEAIKSSDPFELLGHIAFEGLNAESGPDESAYSFLHTWLPRKTVLCIRDDTWSGDCQLRDDVKAEMFVCPSANGDAQLFVPGYGFCLAQRPEPSPKRPKLEPVFHQLQNHFPLTSLVLRPNDDLSTDEIQKLLRIVKAFGPQLHSLRIEATLDEDAIKQVLEFCPRLTSLAVAKLCLPSFNVFEEAYANGAQISSLSLEDMDVPTESVDAFVSSLAQTKPRKSSVAATLKRLGWGSCRPETHVDTALMLFTSVLDKNPNLTHFHGIGSESTRALEQLMKYHGQRVPGLNHSQKAQLMAFLGGVRAVADSNPALSMDAFVKARVWEFAVTPSYRDVLWTVDWRPAFHAA